MQTPYGITSEALAKRIIFLAYQASRPMGAGFLRVQDDVTEDDIWKNAYNRGDYFGGRQTQDKPNTVYADYVFGRMMKVGVEWTADTISIRCSGPRTDYQSWAVRYMTTDKLLAAAIDSFTPNTPS